MLLFVLKHLRPCLANPLREMIAKALDGPNKAAFKELNRVIKFVLDIKNNILKIEPKYRMLKIPGPSLCFVRATMLEIKTPKSVLQDFVYFWFQSVGSRAQKSVTLSSSEAEFVALSKAAKEIKFVVQVLLSIGIPVKLPVIVRVDNVGAILLGRKCFHKSENQAHWHLIPFCERVCGRRIYQDHLCQNCWEYSWYFHQECIWRFTWQAYWRTDMGRRKSDWKVKFKTGRVLEGGVAHI